MKLIKKRFFKLSQIERFGLINQSLNPMGMME